MDEGLALEPEFHGNAYDSDLPRVPSTMREAAQLFSASPVLRRAFGDDVVDHYANYARVELDAYDAAVTIGSVSGLRTTVSTATAVLNPATETVIAEVPELSAAEADAAIERAAAAFPTWSAVSPADRARLLRRFADRIDAARDELADLEVAGAGHTISNARWEAGNVRDVVEYYAGAPSGSSAVRSRWPGVDVTFREPLGVVGVIVPWNFPMVIAGWGFAPALAAVTPWS